jgi:hypothetical protein
MKSETKQIFLKTSSIIKLILTNFIRIMKNISTPKKSRIGKNFNFTKQINLIEISCFLETVKNAENLII